MKKILLLAQKIIGEKCFKILTKCQLENIHLEAVVSNESNDVWWKTNEIYKEAKKHKIPFISNKKRNEEQIKKIILKNNINTIISVQHPWILSEEILSLVDYQCFNFHNAKLPDYKGHNCCNHAILNKEKYYYCTVHWMIKEIDMGSIIREKRVKIDLNETALSLYVKAIQSSESLFIDLLKDLSKNNHLPKSDINRKGIFYPRNSLNTERLINNPDNIEEMDLKSRGLFFPPFEPAYYKKSGKKFYVLPEHYQASIDVFNQLYKD